MLFWLFAAGALGFGTVLVTQQNPARGAIAFAFVVLSTCGLFLLLAAPFLMAATIIIYAGAIIVTFLFVLMLSHADGPSDENDRSREPLLGSFAGFAFAGLVLFTLYQTSQATRPARRSRAPPAGRRCSPPSERTTLADVVASSTRRTRNWTAARRRRSRERPDRLLRGDRERPRRRGRAGDGDSAERVAAAAAGEGPGLATAKPGAATATDPQAGDVLGRAERVREANCTLRRARQRTASTGQAGHGRSEGPGPDAPRRGRPAVRGRRPARAATSRNLGLVLYSEHLLAVELAGTLLLVATIGAIAIAAAGRGSPQ